MMAHAATPPEEAATLPIIGVLVSGRGSNLTAIVEAIQRGELRARVGLVIASRPDAPALARAAEYGLPTAVIAPRAYASRAEAGSDIVAALRAAHVVLVVLAGYKPILDASVVLAFPERLLNVHPSLLPAFAGGMAPRPQADALAAGVKLSGCTVHFVTEAVDAGPIIAQAAVPVLDDDTVETLAERILAQEHRLLPQTIARVLSGRLRVVGQRVIER
ncbi:MAG TPA: phosphoribosylglycinamide formyltransferase [Ktedonobacterales bacterium]|jgi:phosphoribosylglycinamide formyltransferase-1|nr:phosphoribosylglycinamide formyltransferase [Ktedonobacterales bacterium]